MQLGGGSTFLEVSKKDFEKFKIAIPPLPEQQKIAEIINTWDKFIEKQSQLIEKLELRKKGLMQQLLTGKQRLPGFSDPWKVYKLGELFQERNEKIEQTYLYFLFQEITELFCKQNLTSEIHQMKTNQNINESIKEILDTIPCECGKDEALYLI